MPAEKGEFDVPIDELPTELVIELEPTIKFNGVEYAEIRLREPTAEAVEKAETHLKDTNNSTFRKYEQWLVHLCSEPQVPFPVMQKMPVSKLNRGAMYLQAFTKAHLPTTTNA